MKAGSVILNSVVGGEGFAVEAGAAEFKVTGGENPVEVGMAPFVFWRVHKVGAVPCGEVGGGDEKRVQTFSVCWQASCVILELFNRSANGG